MNFNKVSSNEGTFQSCLFFGYCEMHLHVLAKDSFCKKGFYEILKMFGNCKLHCINKINFTWNISTFIFTG